MSWRVVVISKRAKLDFKMNFLVIRNEDGEKRIFLGDISVIVVESTAVSLTTYLISELIERKIKIIFCDNKHNPSSELIPMYGSYVSSGRIRSQIKWGNEIKSAVWQRIIYEKIINQAEVLQRIGKLDKADMLRGYAKEITPGDTTNREGHAAKVYFHALFGEDFFRDSSDIRNSILNYGYSILLSCFNREISANGYLTQLGIWHDNAENPFNLGCDLMEPYRPIIDLFTTTTKITNFEAEEKHTVLNLLNSKIFIGGQMQFLNNAISLYTRSVFTAMEEENVEKIISYEL